MANHHPRRAIGSAQRRTIEARLRWHVALMRWFEARGMNHERASRAAFKILKAHP